KSCLCSQARLYRTIIEDVIEGCNVIFKEEGMEENVILELKRVRDSTCLTNGAIVRNPWSDLTVFSLSAFIMVALITLCFYAIANSSQLSCFSKTECVNGLSFGLAGSSEFVHRNDFRPSSSQQCGAFPFQNHTCIMAFIIRVLNNVVGITQQIQQAHKFSFSTITHVQLHQEALDFELPYRPNNTALFVSRNTQPIVQQNSSSSGILSQLHCHFVAFVWPHTPDKLSSLLQDPLNSGDDGSEHDMSELFDVDNVIVCQFDKIHRSKNRWKFHFKDGIMNLNGRDYVFSKLFGEAEW
uniref:Uncharacterized protein n=1 Tax=Eptatretus burgeri TaxID=7764 RepID=A0A8C4N9B8_EPTBU